MTQLSSEEPGPGSPTRGRWRPRRPPAAPRRPGFRRGGVTLAELLRHAVRAAPDDREAPSTTRSSVSAERSIGNAFRGDRAGRQRAEVARVESGQVMDPVTEPSDLDQRIRTTVVHPRPRTRHPLATEAVAELCASAVRGQELDSLLAALWSAASHVVAGRRIRSAASPATSAYAAASRKKWLPAARMTSGASEGTGYRRGG
jgi:hypothetical protein